MMAVRKEYAAPTGLNFVSVSILQRCRTYGARRLGHSQRAGRDECVRAILAEIKSNQLIQF